MISTVVGQYHWMWEGGMITVVGTAVGNFEHSNLSDLVVYYHSNWKKNLHIHVISIILLKGMPIYLLCIFEMGDVESD